MRHEPFKAPHPHPERSGLEPLYAAPAQLGPTHLGSTHLGSTHLGSTHSGPAHMGMHLGTSAPHAPASAAGTCVTGVGAHTSPPNTEMLLAKAGAMRMHRPDPPALTEPTLAGRSDQLDQLRDFLKGQRAIQLLGEARMGASHTMAWAWWSLIQEGRPAALIDASKLEHRDHTGLLVAAARSLGRDGLEARVRRALQHGTQEGFVAALQALVPAYVLIDHAHVLEDAEPAFPKSFFNAWRTLNERGTEHGRLIWVSAARACVYQKYKSRGSSSTFLNDAAKIWLGALELQAARSWLETRLGGHDRVRLALPFAVHQILDVAGGFAEGLRWFSEQLLMRPDHIDDISDLFRVHFGPVFHTWWSNRDTQEHLLLKRCARERIDVRAVKAQDRRSERLAIRRLESLGLVAEQNGHYIVPGSAWRHFVQTSEPASSGTRLGS